MKKWLLVLLLFLVPSLAEAGTYYVKNGASGSWAGATSRTTPCSYSTANTNASAGDTVIFINDGGAYNVSTLIDPSNSGSAGGGYITFEGETGTTVTVNHSGDGVKLINKSYIIIDNLLFRRMGGSNSWIDAQNYGNTGYVTHHITIQGCTFQDAAPDTLQNKVWAGFWFTGNIHHISVLNNTIGDTVGSQISPDDLIHFNPRGASYTVEYLLFEGNTIYGGCHSALGIKNASRYAIVRNNNIRNPNHRALEIFAENQPVPSWILVENNVIADSGDLCDSETADDCAENIFGSSQDRTWDRQSHPNFQYVGNYGIVRRNVFYNGGSGLTNTQTQNVSYNRFYHNVSYKNVRGQYTNTTSVTAATDNQFVNNVYVDNDLSGSVSNYPVYYEHVTASPCVNIWRNNNFDGYYDVYSNTCEASDGAETVTTIEGKRPTRWYDNLQVASGFTSKTTYDFTLTVGSNLIDAGAWLTLANGSGTNSTTLVVDDARYFSDGWGMITGDTITIQGATPSATVTITNVNYTTNTITLSSARSWSNNTGIAHGTVSGSAPDIGVYEYDGGGSGDTTYPVLSSLYPESTQACPSSPISRSPRINATDNIAVTGCKAHLTDVVYGSMTIAMTQSQDIWTVTSPENFTCGQSHTVYFGCTDAAGNITYANTTFTVEDEAVAPPASFVVRGIVAGLGTWSGGGQGGFGWTPGGGGGGGGGTHTDYTADANCQGAWRMNGNPSETDRSGNGYTLTVSTDDTIPTSATVPSGYAGTSRNFEVLDEEYLYITEGSAPNLDINGADAKLTICGWVQMGGAQSAGEYRAIAGKYGDSTYRQYAIYTLGYGDNVVPSFIVSSTGANSIEPIGTTLMQVGVWYHICGVSDDINVMLYVNGALENQVAHTAGIWNAGNRFMIGARDTDGTGALRFFDGPIDEVIVFNRALSVEEINELKNYGIDGTLGASD
jgi:plastocyanin